MNNFIFKGMRFVTTEIKAALVAIIRNFDIFEKVINCGANKPVNVLVFTGNKSTISFKKILIDFEIVMKVFQ